MIQVRRGAIFDTKPSPMAPDFNFDRFEGMMLGLAVDDSLGNTSEGMGPRSRAERYREIRDYLPNKHAGGKTVGTPSDDTQLAFWTLEQLMADGGLVPAHLASRFCEEQIFGIGNAVKRFIGNIKSGKSWMESGPKSAGNGALMRIAPVIFSHLQSGDGKLWVDTAISAMLTHNDTASISACIAFVAIFWELLRKKQAPEPEWWLNEYSRATRDLELRVKYRPRSKAMSDFEGSLMDFVQREVKPAFHSSMSVLDAGDRWYSGAYLLETVPIVLLILMRYGHDPEEAIVRAVNDTKDNDTVGAIVGAAVGALHGKAELPKRWVEGCLGRTSKDDDGRIFDLLDRARVLWNPNGILKRLHFENRGSGFTVNNLPTISLLTGQASDNCELLFDILSDVTLTQVVVQWNVGAFKHKKEF